MAPIRMIIIGAILAITTTSAIPIPGQGRIGAGGPIEVLHLAALPPEYLEFHKDSAKVRRQSLASSLSQGFMRGIASGGSDLISGQVQYEIEKQLDKDEHKDERKDEH